MKTKRFFLSIMIMLMSAITLISGCSLVQTNTKDYYDKVVASVGDDIKVTKRELINYYSSAVNQGASYTVQEILDEILNRKLIIKEVKDNFSTYVEGIGEELVAEADRDSEYLLKNIKNKYYHNEAMRNAHEYIDSQILNYENIIRSAKGMEIVKDDDDTPSTTYAKETKYEAKYEYRDGKYYAIKDVENESEIIADYDYKHINHGSESIREQAYNMFIKALIRNEEGKNLDKNEQNVLNREIDRVYKIYADDTFNSFFQTKYTYNYALESSDVAKKYRELVQDSYSKYLLEGEKADKQYNINMIGDGANKKGDPNSVYYHPYSNDNTKGFIQVAHILIKFSDEELKGELFGKEGEFKDIGSYKEIVEAFANGSIDEDTYNTRLSAWKAKCMGHKRYTLDTEVESEGKYAGNEYGDAISYADIFSEIRQALKEIDDNESLSSSEKLKQKAEKINYFNYLYNQDSGSLNASNYYTIALDSTVDEGKWAKGFAEVARTVYLGSEDSDYSDYIACSYSGAGAYSKEFFTTTVKETDKDGEKTFDFENAYAGYHMIFVVGKYENLFDETQINSVSDVDIANKLFNTRIMLGTEKTWFDVVADQISYSDFSTYREGIIDTIRENITINYNKSAYKDLMK